MSVMVSSVISSIATFWMVGLAFHLIPSNSGLRWWEVPLILTVLALGGAFWGVLNIGLQAFFDRYF